MSDPLRVALVVEGPTDFVVLRAAIESLLENREFVATSLCPETWVLAALFPEDCALSAIELECRADAATLMQSKPLNQRLKKRPKEYEKRGSELRNAWPHVRAKCSEAERFSRDFLAAVPAVFLAS